MKGIEFLDAQPLERRQGKGITIAWYDSEGNPQHNPNGRPEGDYGDESGTRRVYRTGSKPQAEHMDAQAETKPVAAVSVPKEVIDRLSSWLDKLSTGKTVKRAAPKMSPVARPALKQTEKVPGERLAAAAEELAKKTGISFGEAMQKICKDNPDLFSSYLKGERISY